MPTLTAAAIVAALASASDAEKRAIKDALKVGPTPEQAAASAAYVTRDFTCSVVPSCGRTGFRTAARAAKHGVDDGGHTPKV